MDHEFERMNDEMRCAVLLSLLREWLGFHSCVQDGLPVDDLGCRIKRAIDVLDPPVSPL